ncbi:MAG: hypothetical protein WA628_14285 [Terriglobales bacterium]
MRAPGLLLFLASLVVVACTAEPAAQSSKHQLLLRKHVVVDQQGFGCEAFRMLVPKDWTFQGGIIWNVGKFPPEAQSAYTITSPDSRSVIERFPYLNMFWSPDPMMQQSFASTGAIIMQPMQADAFLRNLYMRRFRPDASAIKIADSQALPELAQRSLQINQYLMSIFGQISPFQFPYEQRSDSARVRFEYTQGGRRMAEDVTATIDYFISTTGSLYGTVQSVSWMPNVISFRAPAEEFDQRAPAYKIVMSTYWDNPRWSVEYTRLSATVTRDQLRQQQAIFNRMQQIHRTQEEISDMIYEGYQRRSAASDHIFDNYIQSLRGVETYADPVNHFNVELPTGYENAWTNGSDYVLSDSSSFDPNLGSTQNWHRMGRKP